MHLAGITIESKKDGETLSYDWSFVFIVQEHPILKPEKVFAQIILNITNANWLYFNIF